MKLNRLTLPMLLMVLLAYSSSAQPSTIPDKTIIFDQLPLNLGLSQRSINCMMQDSEGYLWVGTWSGLIRYDGYETKIYTSKSDEPGAIKSNKITSIIEGVDGKLWIGTRVGGLFQFDKHREQFVQFRHAKDDPTSLSNNNVWSLAQDTDHNLWVGTEDGLNYFDVEAGTFQGFADADGLSDQFITDLYYDRQQRLWACTEYGANLISFEGRKLKATQVVFDQEKSDPELHNYVYKAGSMVINGRERFFFVTKKGLKEWTGDGYINHAYTDRKSSYSFFRSMRVVDGPHPFILVGSEIGLSIFDPISDSFSHFYGNYDKDVNLSHNTIIELFIDRSEVLWVGTKKGLNRFDTYDKDFVLHPTVSFDSTNSIITGIVGRGGRLWISTIGGGLYEFDKEHGRYHKYKIDLDNGFVEFVQKLYLDSQGHLWLGTAGTGIVTFDPNALANADYQVSDYRHYSRADGTLSDDYVMSMTEDMDGNMWVGTWNKGLNRISTTGELTEYMSPQYAQSPIVTLLADRSILWAGTRGSGMNKIDISQGGAELLTTYRYDQETEGISNSFITKISLSPRGNLWVGTEEGLNYLDLATGGFTIHKTTNGLVSNEVNSIIFDDLGQIWLANFKGLTALKANDDRLELINHFDTEDRIQGGFFYSDVSYKAPGGLLYFGGSDGFNIIDPKRILQNPHPAEVVINEVSVFDTPLRLGQPLNGREVLDTTLHQTQNIALKHFENSVKFKFSAMHFAAPAKNKYAYMLAGFDQDWRYTESDQRFANYTNLPDGTYEFKVRASNNDGIWSDSYESIQLTISPPWWRTPLAMLAYVVLVMAILYFFRRLIIIRTNYINNLKLERLEKQNLENLNKAKLEFFTNVSHEFRTPLTLILDPIDRLLNAGEGGKFVKDQLAVVSLNTQRLLRLVNQLLDFRKVESSNVSLQVAEGNIVKFIKEIKLSFDAHAMQRGITFELFTSSNIVNLYFDRDQFEKVVFNLLSNAFKHAPDGGKVTIKVVENEDSVEVIVEDNGQGISSEDFQRIFERFYTKDDHLVSGTGIGLALTKSLVELHGGTIWADSRESEFTNFHLKLPKGKDHFRTEDVLSDFRDSEFIGHYQEVGEHQYDLPQPDTGARKDLTEMDKILLVEDNLELRSYLKSLFLDRYIVLEASNGAEGLEIALEEMPEMIISDVMMPVMDGIAFCKEIKTQVKTSHIPVLLLTARTSLIFRVEGLEHGADDYITKPFNSQVLLLKVRNLIKSRKQLQKLFRDNDELVIEPKKVTLTSADELFVEKALESIERNMSNSEYTVEDFGRDVGLSRMQLYRKLKAMTGQSANEFIRCIRLKRAAQLIAESEMTIAEVTYKVGFSDLHYFRSCFRKQFGVNPSDYAKKDAEVPVSHDSGD